MELFLSRKFFSNYFDVRGLVPPLMEIAFLLWLDVASVFVDLCFQCYDSDEKVVFGLKTA